jgi:phage protein D
MVAADDHRERAMNGDKFERSAFYAPVMRVIADGADVTHQWTINSVTIMSSTEDEPGTAEIVVADSETLASAAFGAMLQIFLGYGDELSGFGPYRLRALRFTEAVIVTLSGELPESSPVSSERSAFEESDALFTIRRGLNALACDLTQTHSENEDEPVLGGFIQLEGEPNLIANSNVELTGFPAWVDGQYRVSSVMHELDASGFKTTVRFS